MRTPPPLFDPFGQSRMPPELADRETRVAIIGRVAEALLAGREPDRSDAFFVGGALIAWLENGGNLERDYLKVVKPQSHMTPAVLWRRIKAHSE